MTDDKHWTTLTTAPNEPMAEVIQQRLEAAGIPVALIPGDASAYLGASSEFEVKVPKDKLTQAQEAIA